MTETRLLHRRFGDARPGMQLLAVEDAAVPVTIVQADVLAQERKPLPIMEEFVLRFVAAGIDNGPDVARMLGIAVDQVLETAAIQVSENNLSRRGGAGHLALTVQGTEVVRALAATQPVLKQLPVVFDRLVWRLVDYTRSGLMTKKDAQERGMHILPAAQKSRIGLLDVTAEQFNALLTAREGREKSVEILRVRRVSPNTHRYLPAKLLIYGDEARAELELAVCIDGEMRTDHGLALDAIDAVKRLGLSFGPSEARPILDEELEVQRVDVTTDAENAPGVVASAAVSPSVFEEPQVRSVSVFEHAELLAEALEGTKKRLLIISPWVRSAVVTTDFIAKLERRLRAGAEVTIAHGYGNDDSGSDAYALKRLENLAARYRDGFTLARLRNTHAKILIADGTWVSTSFNWLSFRGDSDRTYRMEEGTMVRIPEQVDEAYERYRGLVDEQRL